RHSAVDSGRYTGGLAAAGEELTGDGGGLRGGVGEFGFGGGEVALVVGTGFELAIDGLGEDAAGIDVGGEVFAVLDAVPADGASEGEDVVAFVGKQVGEDEGVDGALAGVAAGVAVVVFGLAIGEAGVEDVGAGAVEGGFGGVLNVFGGVVDAVEECLGGGKCVTLEGRADDGGEDVDVETLLRFGGGEVVGVAGFVDGDGGGEVGGFFGGAGGGRG